MNIGQAIANTRKLSGMSQSELAERSGMSASTISAIETGKRIPDLARVSAIANCIEVPVFLIILSAMSSAEKRELPDYLTVRLENWRIEMLSQIADFHRETIDNVR